MNLKNDYATYRMWHTVCRVKKRDCICKDVKISNKHFKSYFVNGCSKIVIMLSVFKKLILKPKNTVVWFYVIDFELTFLRLLQVHPYHKLLQCILAKVVEIILRIYIWYFIYVKFLTSRFASCTSSKKKEFLRTYFFFIFKINFKSFQQSRTTL